MSQYATVDDLAAFGLQASATTGLDTDALEAQLSAASALADSYLSSRGYALPLTTWDVDLRNAVCQIAAWQIVVHHRGVNPSNPAHAALMKSRDDAEAWLRRVAAGQANLVGVSTQLPRARQGVAEVYLPTSDGSRGW